MKIISLFSGCGGLDLGFKMAGFQIPLANEYDSKIWDTFKLNHPDTNLIEGDIRKVFFDLKNIPKDIDGIIGGPPCQSWSEAGSKRGIEDSRGQLFLEYIRILKELKPKFFLAENVSGMLAERHFEAVRCFIEDFEKCGYDLFIELVDASNYGVGQVRQRVFYVGFRKDLHIQYKFPKKTTESLDLKMPLFDTIGDLQKDSIEAENKNKHNKSSKNNNEYYTGSFSPMYMSRNRKKSWAEPAFTVQASGRQCQLHPSSPEMIAVGLGKYIFQQSELEKYRRMSVREIARIQGFPDSFKFVYSNIDDGYKMIGNAVPVKLAYQMALSIKNAIQNSSPNIMHTNIDMCI